MVYIREAHPENSPRARPRNQFKIEDPKTLEERRKVARQFAETLHVTPPILVDTMTDPMRTAYAAWPDRLYVIDAHGKLALVGERGPAGFRPALEKAPGILDKLLGAAQPAQE